MNFPQFFMNMLPGFFQSSLLLYVPLGVLLAFALLMIASVHVSGSKPEAIAKAISSTMMKTLGLLLLAMSSVQLVYGLIAMQIPAIESVFGLILLLAIGMTMMIHESRVLKTVDSASKSVTNAIFVHACKIIGALIAIVSGISLLMTFILGREFVGWEMSATLLLLGCILSLASGIHAAGGVVRRAGKRKR